MDPLRINNVVGPEGYYYHHQNNDPESGSKKEKPETVNDQPVEDKIVISDEAQKFLDSQNPEKVD